MLQELRKTRLHKSQLFDNDKPFMEMSWDTIEFLFAETNYGRQNQMFV